MKINRNDKCSCGSGKKFKACHYNESMGWKIVVDEFGQKHIVKGVKLEKLSYNLGTAVSGKGNEVPV